MARFQRAETIPLWELNALADAAEEGNESAIAELQDLSRIYSQRANKRMQRLESADQTTNALNYAKNYLEDRGRKTFGAGRGEDVDELVENVQQARKFLNMQTSTVGGERQRVRAIDESLQEHGYIDEWQTQEQKKRFYDFLGSDAWKEIKKHGYRSTMLGEIQDAMERGADINELISAVEDYDRQQSTLVITENWMRV